MSFIKENSIQILVVFVFAVLSLIFIYSPKEKTLGSFESYRYTNITSANASATAPVLIRGGAGVLGSITIASTSPSVALGVRVYDGTATSTGTLIGKIKTDATEQTFVFDVAVTKGVVLDVPVGFNGSYIITTK